MNVLWLSANGTIASNECSEQFDVGSTALEAFARSLINKLNRKTHNSNNYLRFPMGKIIESFIVNFSIWPTLF